jgi:bacterial/archaeal transporter family protein
LGPASKVASINKLSVVLVIIAAANFLREPVPFSTAIGGGLVLADVLTLAFV